MLFIMCRPVDNRWLGRRLFVRLRWRLTGTGDLRCGGRALSSARTQIGLSRWVEGILRLRGDRGLVPEEEDGRNSQNSCRRDPSDPENCFAVESGPQSG